jgi:murein DD-endopeptidase MepM/ murein hydrolase activator NlpD
VVVGMLACGAVPAVSAAQENGQHKSQDKGKALQDRKHEVQKNLGRAHDDLDESSAAVREATQKLLQAQADLANARAYLAQTETELAAAKALDARMQRKLDAAIVRLDHARQDLRAGVEDVDSQEKELRRVVVGNYQQGDPDLMGLSMVFTTQDPAQLAGSMNTSSTVVNLETAILDRLEAAKVLLTVREQEMNAAKEDVARKRAAAADNLVRKQSLEAQAREAESQVSQMVDLRAQARAVAEKTKKKDLRQLAALQAEQDRIQALIAAQAASTTGSYSGPSTGNGFLDYPVPGPITSPFGWRIHPIYGYRSLHDGIDIGAACGTPIKAAAPGKVLSEYYQTAWGNRIIIDHGVHYGVGVTTISNHLSGYAVAAGEHVERGQVVGYVGTTGWSTGCHTHFTVMENGTPVDPMKWF